MFKSGDKKDALHLIFEIELLDLFKKTQKGVVNVIEWHNIAVS